MKKEIRYVLIECIVAIIAFFVVIALLVVTVKLNTDTEHIYRAHKSELENAVQQILATGKTDGIVIPGVERIDYWEGEHPIIEFTTSSFGIVPASTYHGFYYSVDAVPASFQNADEKLIKDDQIWKWNADGNEGTTKNIEGNWFVFEASL